MNTISHRNRSMRFGFVSVFSIRMKIRMIFE
jgi:hypothetical protein